MAHEPGSRAAELAAQQVESIVGAAQASADLVQQEAAREAEGIIAQARRDAEKELDRARAEAAKLGEQARRDAESQVEEASNESAQIREQTQRAVEGRVADAEEKAARVMEEAETLSKGLRRLGEALGEQGGRILRDVQAAHRRMQADLQVAAPDPEETLRRARSARTPADSGQERVGGGRRNPFEEIDVPGWVGPDR
jgi:vacuolar-type H+-ATPase subunit E/Vma4